MIYRIRNIFYIFIKQSIKDYKLKKTKAAVSEAYRSSTKKVHDIE